WHLPACRQSAEVFVDHGGDVGQGRVDGDVLVEVVAIDLVQRVIDVVVHVEVVGAVLARLQHRHAEIAQRADVGAAVGGVAGPLDAERGEHFLHGGDQRQALGRHAAGEPPYAAGAEVGFHGDHVPVERIGVFLH